MPMPLGIVATDLNSGNDIVSKLIVRCTRKTRNIPLKADPIDVWNLARQGRRLCALNDVLEQPVGIAAIQGTNRRNGGCVAVDNFCGIEC